MTERGFYSPLKIGLFTVVVAYFLFTLHAMFILSWVGEWRGLPEPVATWVLITDVSAEITLVFRFSAGAIALASITFFLVRRNVSRLTPFKVLRWILILEALYWLGLLPSGIWGVVSVFELQYSLFITSGLPCMVSSIAIPVALFKLASKLNPNGPMGGAIKWGLISGTIYVLVLWLNNAGMWIVTAVSRGTEYIIAYPENLLSFGLTTVGLLALTVFAAWFTKKSIGTETLEKLELRTVGAIVVSLGMYFLWNYLTWIFFGGDYLWSDWYAWFLGHNLDLWMLSLPLVGLPLLFERQDSTPSKEETA
jgi:hypothetical protein